MSPLDSKYSSKTLAQVVQRHPSLAWMRPGGGDCPLELLNCRPQGILVTAVAPSLDLDGRELAPPARFGRRSALHFSQRLAVGRTGSREKDGVG